MTTPCSRRRGFTLLELLLVVVILGLLIALLLPVLTAARRETALVTCTGHLRQLGQAYQLYADDYGALPDPPQALHAAPDRALLTCPNDNGQERLASSYTFRSLVPPDLRPYWEVADLPSSTVLIICPWHTEAELRPTHPAIAPPPFPFKLTLRANGAVQRIRTDQIRTVVVADSRLRTIRVYPGEPGYELAARGTP